MNTKPIPNALRDQFNAKVTHPLQAYEWGEFREKTRIKVIRRGFEKNGKLVEGFQVTIHQIPHTPFFAGYLPKGIMPTEEMIEELKKIGGKSAAFSFNSNQMLKKFQISNFKFQILTCGRRTTPLFTKYTLVLDLTKSEDELLKNMHSKTRYNIRVAEKHGVVVKEDDSDKAFEEYVALTKETTSRQGFFAHNEEYHRLMWETLRSQSAKRLALNESKLTAHLLTAKYQGNILVTWIVFIFHDTLYYPYGASSSDHREVMASTAMMWETIKFGKKLGLTKFDMWGALGPDPDPKDPWYGFHRFKQGFGPELVEFVGSYDLVINPMLYQLYKVADKTRWALLRLKQFAI